VSLLRRLCRWRARAAKRRRDGEDLEPNVARAARHVNLDRHEVRQTILNQRLLRAPSARSTEITAGHIRGAKRAVPEGWQMTQERATQGVEDQAPISVLSTLASSLF